MLVHHRLVLIVIALFCPLGGYAGEHAVSQHETVRQPAPSAVPGTLPAPDISVAQATHGSRWRAWLSSTVPAQLVIRSIEDFKAKVRSAATLDQDNDELRKRVAELEFSNSRSSDEAVRCRELARADKLKNEAVAEGGIVTARTIASVRMNDETMLSRPPKIIFDGASKAFAAGDYETAAKAFAFLVDHAENEAFQDAQTYYLAGVSLYKLGNYKRAIGYLRKSLSQAKGENLAYGPRALGWVALSYRKLGDVRAEKAVVRELIQMFPRSQEARRLNRNA